MKYRIWYSKGRWHGLLLKPRRARLRFYADTRHDLFRQMGEAMEHIVGGRVVSPS